jgi:Flp pilus assembly protein TadD
VVNNLAALLLDHRDDKESLARALELAKSLGNTGDAVILDTLGWAYYRNADFPNAVRQLERAVAANDADPVLQYHLGMAYAAAGNRVSAKQHLEGALARGGADARLVADAKAALAKLGE